LFIVGAVAQLVTCLPAGRERCPRYGVIIRMYIIYALEFINGRIYVGMTNNLNRRIEEHRRNKTKSTKNRGKFNVIIIEEQSESIIARQREKYWKSGCGKERLKNLER